MGVQIIKGGHPNRRNKVGLEDSQGIQSYTTILIENIYITKKYSHIYKSTRGHLTTKDGKQDHKDCCWPLAVFSNCNSIFLAASLDFMSACLIGSGILYLQHFITTSTAVSKDIKWPAETNIGLFVPGAHTAAHKTSPLSLLNRRVQA